MYAMPLDGDIHIMFYNRTAFERPENKEKFKSQFGYELAPPQTWTQWDDMAKIRAGGSPRQARVLQSAGEKTGGAVDVQSGCAVRRCVRSVGETEWRWTEI